MKFLAKIYFLIAFLNSLWFVWFWHVPQSYIWGINSFGILFALFNNKWFAFIKPNCVSVIMLYSVVFLCRGGLGSNMFGYFGDVLYALPLTLFLLLKNDIKCELYNFLRQAFIWICGVSLFFWLLHQIGIQLLPSFVDYYGVFEGEMQYPIENHILYTISLAHRVDDFGGFPRFCALFTEPGFLCCLISLMLFIDGYRIDRFSDKVLYVIAFFTFSLAGWILIVLGFLLYTIRNSQHRFSSIFFATVLASSIYAYGVMYNGGENVVSNRIFDRLEYDEEEENISGYNRTSKKFDDWFSDVFIKSNDAIWGNNNLYATNFDNSHSVGWKVFTVKYGFVGLFLYILFLYFLSKRRKNKYLDYCLLLLMVLVFARGHGIYMSFAFLASINTGFLFLGKDEKDIEHVQLNAE